MHLPAAPGSVLQARFSTLSPLWDRQWVCAGDSRPHRCPGRTGGWTGSAGQGGRRPGGATGCGLGHGPSPLQASVPSPMERVSLFPVAEVTAAHTFSGLRNTFYLVVPRSGVQHGSRRLNETSAAQHPFWLLWGRTRFPACPPFSDHTPSLARARPAPSMPVVAGTEACLAPQHSGAGSLPPAPTF